MELTASKCAAMCEIVSAVNHKIGRTLYCSLATLVCVCVCVCVCVNRKERERERGAIVLCSGRDSPLFVDVGCFNNPLGV